jgi:hypothetical protein
MTFYSMYISTQRYVFKLQIVNLSDNVDVFVLCLQVEGKGVEGDCMLECGPDKTCHVDTCCANRKSKVFSGGDGEVSTARLRANGHSSAVELAAATGDGAADGGLQFVAIQASSDGYGDDVVVR